jgi:hypothetical protein
MGYDDMEKFIMEGLRRDSRRQEVESRHPGRLFGLHNARRSDSSAKTCASTMKDWWRRDRVSVPGGFIVMG